MELNLAALRSDASKLGLSAKGSARQLLQRIQAHKTMRQQQAIAKVQAFSKHRYDKRLLKTTSKKHKKRRKCDGARNKTPDATGTTKDNNNSNDNDTDTTINIYGSSGDNNNNSGSCSGGGSSSEQVGRRGTVDENKLWRGETSEDGNQCMFLRSLSTSSSQVNTNTKTREEKESINTTMTTLDNNKEDAKIEIQGSGGGGSEKKQRQSEAHKSSVRGRQHQKEFLKRRQRMRASRSCSKKKKKPAKKVRWQNYQAHPHRQKLLPCRASTSRNMHNCVTCSTISRLELLR